MVFANWQTEITSPGAEVIYFAKFKDGAAKNLRACYKDNLRYLDV